MNDRLNFCLQTKWILWMERDKLGRDGQHGPHLEKA